MDAHEHLQSLATPATPAHAETVVSLHDRVDMLGLQCMKGMHAVL